jgi:hypothetical protein
MKKLILILAIFALQQAQAGLLYTYNQLTLMELDQLNQLVQDKIKESKKSDAKMVPLKEALQALYARPDQDRMLEKVAGPLRNELIEIGQYERAMTQLTEEALNALTNTRNFRPPVQVTYLVFLENLMADLKPALKTENKFEKGLVEKIKKAKIKITKPAQNDLVRRGFSEKKSPSEVASLILSDLKDREEQSKKAKKETVETNTEISSETDEP